MNNNTAMVTDLMGNNDEFGDYGEEEAGFTKEQEAAYDFM